MEEILDKYHYIIGVATHPALAGEKAGKLYMKYFLSYSKEELREFNLAKTMVENKMWPTTYTEALEGTKCNSLLGNLFALQMGVQANQATLHHFTTNLKMDDKFFESLVNLANTNENNRKLLNKSRIY